MDVAIIDYGSGNLRSVAKAIERVAAELGRGQTVTVTSDPAALDAARHVVLPGVGAFGDCMAGLEALDGMRESLERNVIRAAKPFLGICVGMQLMADKGIEHGAHGGLGWIEGIVAPIEPLDSALKIPHMGWNEIEVADSGHPVLAQIETGAHAYFVHSFSLRCEREKDILAHVDYGGR
ncbi:MAG: imidazole glycerol phosphate synthase subunit HisH, partial [Alphaproteobacteria bacterium]